MTVTKKDRPDLTDEELLAAVAQAELISIGDRASEMDQEQNR